MKTKLLVLLAVISLSAKAQTFFNAAIPANAVGTAFLTLANPSVISFPRINADNSVSALNQTNFLNAVVPSQSGNSGKVLSTNGTVASWQPISTTSTDWLTNGNTGTDPTTDFLGTDDSTDFVIRTNNVERLRVIRKGGFLGLGTSTPLSNLDMVTTFSTTSTFCTGIRNSTGNYLFGGDNAGHFGINMNGGVASHGVIPDCALEVCAASNNSGDYTFAAKNTDRSFVSLRCSNHNTPGAPDVELGGSIWNNGYTGFGATGNTSYRTYNKGFGNNSSTFSEVVVNSDGTNMRGMRDDGLCMIHKYFVTFPFASNALVPLVDGTGTFNGANVALSSLDNSTGSILNIVSTTASAVNIGPSITGFAVYDGGLYPMGNIAFRRENGASGNSAGYIQFSAHTTATGGLTEFMRITSTGGLSFAGASNYGTSGQVLTSNGNASPTWQTPATGSATTVVAGSGVSVAGTAPTYTVSVTNPICNTTLSLSSTDIKNATTIPIQIVAAPGSGYAIEVVSASVSYTYGGTAFDANSGITLLTETAASTNYQAISGLNISTANSSRITRFAIQATTGNSLIDNKALDISTQSDSTVGNGTAKVYLSYRIITL